MKSNNNNNDQKLLKFLGRVAIGAVASVILTPPVALYIGSWTVFTGKCVEYMIEKEEDKETFKFMAECGKDVATGGLFNCLVGTKAISLTSETTNKIGHLVSKEIAQHGMTDIAKELIINGGEISELQKDLEFINNVKEKLSSFSELIEQINHKKHLDNEINYLEGCEICKL